MAPIPKTMSGVVIEQPGGPEVLKWKTDLRVPDLQEGEVLVKNEIIGVNFVEIYFRTGLYKAPSYPLITGKEAAGTVVAAHASVRGFKPGDRVAYMPNQGAYAELTAVPAENVTHVPAGVSAEQAAAGLLQGLTALTLIREAAQIRPGSGSRPWALVHAAAGGTGGLLVQMLHADGLQVIGTAGSAEKCALARENGADHVLNSREDDVAARVKEITGGKGPDFIFDGVGKATFDMDLDMIAPKGSLVMFGNASGAVPPVDLFRLGPKNIRLMRPVLHNYFITDERETYTAELFNMISSGKIKIKIHDTYPLKEVARAHSDLEGRKTTGKLLLKV